MCICSYLWGQRRSRLEVSALVGALRSGLRGAEVRRRSLLLLLPLLAVAPQHLLPVGRHLLKDQTEFIS